MNKNPYGESGTPDEINTEPAGGVIRVNKQWPRFVLHVSSAGQIMTLTQYAADEEAAIAFVHNHTLFELHDVQQIEIDEPVWFAGEGESIMVSAGEVYEAQENNGGDQREMLRIREDCEMFCRSDWKFRRLK